MDTTAPEPRVLVFGLDPHRVPGPWDPAPVVDAIAVGVTRFADAWGRISGGFTEIRLTPGCGIGRNTTLRCVGASRAGERS